MEIQKTHLGYKIDLDTGYTAHRLGTNRPGVMTLLSERGGTNYLKVGQVWVATNKRNTRLVMPGSLEHKAFEALKSKKK